MSLLNKRIHTGDCEDKLHNFLLMMPKWISVFKVFYHSDCLDNVNLQLHLHLPLSNHRSHLQTIPKREQGLVRRMAALQGQRDPNTNGPRGISWSSARGKCKLMPLGRNNPRVPEDAEGGSVGKQLCREAVGNLGWRPWLTWNAAF